MVPGLTVDPACPPISDESNPCRTIIVPNIPGEYPYQFKISFYGDFVYTL